MKVDKRKWATGGAARKKAELLRFLEKVPLSPNDGCWEWAGMRHKSGYGWIRRNGTSMKASRAAWELLVGPIPEGLEVCHHCDNPPCVNPAHLFLGTHLENMRDLRSKRAWPTARLNWYKVRSIRLLYKSGARQRDLGSAFGVSQMNIWRIVHKKTWIA